MKIIVTLYYHLKEKAGIGEVNLEVDDHTTIKDIKQILEKTYPPLRTHLDNVMVLMDQKIVLDEDLIQPDANIAFLTPVGGG